MDDRVWRVLITGLPGSGKTTLIKKLSTMINGPFCGFFTGEIRDRGKRAGFEIESFSGKRAVMAHVEYESPYKVGKYGVNIKAIDDIAIPEIKSALAGGRLILIDEIGKMELGSNQFRELILEIFSREIPIVATIMYKSHPFCDKLKKSPRVKIFNLKDGKADGTANLILGTLTVK